MRIQVTFTLDDEDGDPGHELGVTEDQYMALIDGDLPSGARDVDVLRID